MDSHSKLGGEFLDAEGGLTVEALQINTFDSSHINYAMRLSHLHGPAAAAFAKTLRAEQAAVSDTVTPQEAAVANTKRLMEALTGPGVDLLLREPTLDIPHLGFAIPEGALDISVKASMPGVTKEEIQGPADALKTAVMKRLRMTADIRIDTAMLDKLLASAGKADTAGPMLQGLERQGYIKLDGKALTTHLAYMGGQLKVNGQPFPPRPPGAPPQ